MTKKKYIAHRIFQIACSLAIFLCLFVPPSQATEIRIDSGNVDFKESAKKDDGFFSSLSNAMKKQKEKLAPKTATPTSANETTSTEYGPAIEKALAKAGIKKTYVETVKYKYPDSAINKLKDMTEAQKLDVAAGILYIKKCSHGRVSNTDIIRESAAIVYYANKYKVPVPAAFAMADLESHCNPRSIGHRGPIGPFQILWRCHAANLIRRKFVSRREDMLDADKGVHAGVFVFAGYVHRAGSLMKSLRHYKGRPSKRYTNMFFAKLNKFIAVRSSLKKSL